MVWVAWRTRGTEGDGGIRSGTTKLRRPGSDSPDDKLDHCSRPPGPQRQAGRTVRVGLLVPIGPVSPWTTLWVGPRPQALNVPWVVMPTHAPCGRREAVAAPTRSRSNCAPGDASVGRWSAAARWPTGSRAQLVGLAPARAAATRPPAPPPWVPRSLSGHTSHARSNRSGKPARHAAPPRRVVRVSGQVSTAGPPNNPQAGRPRRHPRAVPASSACRSQPRGIPDHGRRPGSRHPRMQQEAAGRGNLHPRTGRRRLRPGGTVRSGVDVGHGDVPGRRPWWGPPR